MLTKEDYTIMLDCMETKTRADGKEFYVIKDATPKHIAQLVRDVMYRFDGSIATLDLQYEVTRDALAAMYDGAEYEQITGENFEPMLEGEHASVYTANRLAYLNPHNDEEIAEIMKDYSLNDVSTACAIWYDNTVNEMVDALIDAVVSYEYQTGCPHFTGADSGAVCTKCSKFPTI